MASTIQQLTQSQLIDSDQQQPQQQLSEATQQPQEQQGYASEHSDETDGASTSSSANHSEDEDSQWETESDEYTQEQADQEDEEQQFFESELVPGSRLEAEIMKDLEKSYPSQLKPRKAGKKQHAESTHASYVVSKDVIEGIISHTQQALRHTDKDKLLRTMLTANHNIRPLSQPYSKYTVAQTTKADREADKEIKDAFASGKPISEHAAMRACQQFNVLCEMSESIPRDVFHVMIACYGKLKATDGEAAVPKATRAILTKVRTAKPHQPVKAHSHAHHAASATTASATPKTVAVQGKAIATPSTATATATATATPTPRNEASCGVYHRPLRPHRLHHIVL